MFSSIARHSLIKTIDLLRQCDGKPPVGGIGPAYADCQLCAKRGTACVFAPLNKRGTAPFAGMSCVLRRSC
jgi:hypothetical protein